MNRRRAIVSYPKSGRTWLRVLLGKYLADHVGASNEEIVDLDRLLDRLGLPPIELNHDLSGARELRSKLKADKAAFRNRDVVLLTRGVPDTVVSSYFQATRRRDVFDGTLTEFTRSDEFGTRKVITFLEQWYAARDTPAAFLRVSYESLQEDPVVGLTAVLGFLGVDDVDPAGVDAAVEYARFENMQRLERNGALRSNWMRPRDPKDPESFKVRRGTVGGYRDYLSPTDIEFVEALVARSSCPWVRME